MKLNDRQLARAWARVFGTELREDVTARDRRRGMTTVRESLAAGVPFQEAAVQGNTVACVAVLTPRSVNGGPGGRRYQEGARQDAADRINAETVQAFLDHSEGERSVRDLVGTFRRGRVDGGGTVRANLRLLDTPVRPALLDAAENDPGALALSIDARGSARMEGDVPVVTGIDVLRSVDVVAQPASTSGLFEALRESRGRRGFKPVTDKAIYEAYTRLF